MAAGHAERAAAAIAEGRTLVVDAEGEPDHTWLHLADAELALARGDHGEALAAAQRCGEAAAAMLVWNPVLLPWRSVALRAALALGERDRATELAEDESALARSFGTATAVGAALHGCALTGPPVERSERLFEAAAWLAPSGSQLLHSHALTDLGTSLRRDRRERDAREPLRRAVACYRACNADALAEAADAELRAAGGRPRREAVEGADALTAAERRIADLAAAGRSNPQIARELVLTRRTVETHLTSIYRKLDVGGREGLGTKLADG